MEFLPALRAVNPGFVAFGAVALALTMLTAALGTSVTKASQPSQGE